MQNWSLLFWRLSPARATLRSPRSLGKLVRSGPRRASACKALGLTPSSASCPRVPGALSTSTYRWARPPSGTRRTLEEEKNSEALGKDPKPSLPQISWRRPKPRDSDAPSTEGYRWMTEVQRERTCLRTSVGMGRGARVPTLPHSSSPPAPIPQPTHPRTLQSLEEDRSREKQSGKWAELCPPTLPQSSSPPPPEALPSPSPSTHQVPSAAFVTLWTLQ